MGIKWFIVLVAKFQSFKWSNHTLLSD